MNSSRKKTVERLKGETSIGKPRKKQEEKLAVPKKKRSQFKRKEPAPPHLALRVPLLEGVIKEKEKVARNQKRNQANRRQQPKGKGQPKQPSLKRWGFLNQTMTTPSYAKKKTR